MWTTGNSIDEIYTIKTALHHQFAIKDLGVTKYILGIQLCSNAHGTVLYQKKNIMDILTEFQMTEASPAKTSLPVGLKLEQNVGKIVP